MDTRKGSLLVEKRKYPRWTLLVPIRYKIIKGDKLNKFTHIFKKYQSGNTADISAGGVLLEAAERIALSSLVQLEIFFEATDSTVKITGEIVRYLENESKSKEGKYLHGVRFVEINTESDEMLDEIIEEKFKTGKSVHTKEEIVRAAREEYFLKLIDLEIIEKQRNA